MDELTDDEQLADLIADVAQDVLARIGSDPEARHQYFRAFIDLSKRMVEQNAANTRQ
jgi:hypothetical protein